MLDTGRNHKRRKRHRNYNLLVACVRLVVPFCLRDSYCLSSLRRRSSLFLLRDITAIKIKSAPSTTV